MSDLDLFSLWDIVVQKTKDKIPPQMWEPLVVNALMPYSLTSEMLTLYVMDKSKLKYIQSPLINNPLLHAVQDVVSSIRNISYITELPETTDIVESSNPSILSNTYQSYDDVYSAVPEVAPIPSNQSSFTNDALPSGASRPTYDEPIIIDRNRQRPADIQKPITENLFELKDTPKSGPMTGATKKESYANMSRSHLIDKFTFENFITSTSNQYAFNAALAVAREPGRGYNPLYIYGKSGLGKTHLMHAIGNEIIKNNPAAKIMCITSEDFMNSFIDSIRNKTPNEFRSNFRDIDVLIIDDVQFLEEENKKNTQEEFFNTFNHLLTHNKAVILSSDVPPNEYTKMEDRLITRFNSGMTVKIEAPSPEMIEAIIYEEIENARLKFPKLQLPKSVVNLFSQGFNKRNIRELKGAFSRLVLHADADNCLDSIDLEYASLALKDFNVNTEKVILSIDYIQNYVANYFKIKLEHLVGKKRNKQYVYPRQIGMYLSRELVNESFPQIAHAFGKKDHTTALHAYEKIAQEMQKDPALQQTVQTIIKELKEGT